MKKKEIFFKKWNKKSLRKASRSYEKAVKKKREISDVDFDLKIIFF